MKQLYVHVNIDNKAALDLYAKAGFEVCNHSRQHSHVLHLIRIQDNRVVTAQ